MLERLGRFDEAERHFEVAIETERRMRARPWLAHAQHDLAAMLLAPALALPGRAFAQELQNRPVVLVAAAPAGGGAQAVDATNGDFLWEFRPPTPKEGNGTVRPTPTRNIAIYGERIFVTSAVQQCDNARARDPHRCPAGRPRRAAEHRLRPRRGLPLQAHRTARAARRAGHLRVEHLRD